MSIVTETFLTFQSGWVLSALTEGWDTKGKPPSLCRPVCSGTVSRGCVGLQSGPGASWERVTFQLGALGHLSASTQWLTWAVISRCCR